MFKDEIFAGRAHQVQIPHALDKRMMIHWTTTAAVQHHLCVKGLVQSIRISDQMFEFVAVVEAIVGTSVGAVAFLTTFIVVMVQKASTGRRLFRLLEI